MTNCHPWEGSSTLVLIQIGVSRSTQRERRSSNSSKKTCSNFSVVPKLRKPPVRPNCKSLYFFSLVHKLRITFLTPSAVFWDNEFHFSCIHASLSKILL